MWYLQSDLSFSNHISQSNDENFAPIAAINRVNNKVGKQESMNEH